MGNSLDCGLGDCGSPDDAEASDYSKPVEGIICNGELLGWDEVEKQTHWTRVEGARSGVCE